jgi:predicted nucleic acid-binding protein
VLGVLRQMKLYLETTVFNYYFDAERDGHDDTIRLFEEIRAGKHEAYTSVYAYNELDVASEPKRSKMLALVEEYGITLLDITNESDNLAALYIAENIIPARFLTDASHISVASIHSLDCIVSYNFKHINRVKTKLLTGRVNRAHNYGNAVICTAKEVLDDESDET